MKCSWVIVVKDKQTDKQIDKNRTLYVRYKHDELSKYFSTQKYRKKPQWNTVVYAAFLCLSSILPSSVMWRSFGQTPHPYTHTQSHPHIKDSWAIWIKGKITTIRSHLMERGCFVHLYIKTKLFRGNNHPPSLPHQACS